MHGLSSRQGGKGEVTVEFSIVVRSSGERTASKIVEALSNQYEFVANVSNDPFEATLVDAYQAGIHFDRPWTVMVDADVIPYYPGIVSLYQAASELPENCIGANGRTFDKILNRLRPVGVRIFRTKFLPDLIQRIPEAGIEQRPETHAHRCLERQGFSYRKLPVACGLHGFEQWNADLISTSISLAKKTSLDSEQAPKRWAELGNGDYDYRMIQLGTLLGQLTDGPAVISRKALGQSIFNLMQSFGICEKHKLDKLPEQSVVEKLITTQEALPFNRRHKHRQGVAVHRTILRSLLVRFRSLGIFK